MQFLTGKDYPWVCSSCQAVIDQCAEVVQEGPDTDDPEAPLLFAGDHQLFCGGRECVNRPEKEVEDLTCQVCGYTCTPEDGFHKKHGEYTLCYSCVEDLQWVCPTCYKKNFGETEEPAKISSVEEDGNFSIIRFICACGRSYALRRKLCDPKYRGKIG